MFKIRLSWNDICTYVLNYDELNYDELNYIASWYKYLHLFRIKEWGCNSANNLSTIYCVKSAILILNSLNNIHATILNTLKTASATNTTITNATDIKTDVKLSIQRNVISGNLDHLVFHNELISNVKKYFYEILHIHNILVMITIIY